MNTRQTLLSSIGQKLLLATSGLIMFLIFLIPHMGGNVLFLFGPDLYNSYSHHLHQLEPLLIVVETILLVSILVHMAMAFRVVVANHQARGKRHTQKPSEERSWAARLMPVSGVMILIFIIKHLLDFKFYEQTKTELHGHMVNNTYAMVLGRFQDDPLHMGIYLFFMVAVGLHLSHALQSSLQTYGWYVPRKGSRIKFISTIVGCGMAATFAIIPFIAFIK